MFAATLYTWVMESPGRRMSFDVQTLINHLPLPGGGQRDREGGGGGGDDNP